MRGQILNILPVADRLYIPLQRLASTRQRPCCGGYCDDNINGGSALIPRFLVTASTSRRTPYYRYVLLQTPYWLFFPFLHQTGIGPRRVFTGPVRNLNR